MSLWSRIANVFRPNRLNEEIDEELESHIAMSIAEGKDSKEARRAIGSQLRHREASRDIQVTAWLDSLRSDTVFSWRQLKKNWVTSLAAVLSLALAMGACTSAFRLYDALFLRPLPIKEPGRLYAFQRQSPRQDGTMQSFDGVAYPMLQQMRSAAKGSAEVLAISYAERMDLTFASIPEMEKAYWQYVSGWTFHTLDIQPALGRVLAESDDMVPKAHPVAVLSHDYWTRRFGQDRGVVGRSFRSGTDVYEIVGVSQEGFTGTEPGVMVDVFVPSMMNESVTRPDSTWLRPLLYLEPGSSPRVLRDKLQSVVLSFERERSKTFRNLPKDVLTRFLNQTVLLYPSPSGASGLQAKNRVALRALAVLVGLVLLIACVNLANLMTARAAARAREMAMRISIGAGRSQVVQLVLVESAWIAIFATLLGSLIAWFSTPVIIAMMNPADNPVRLIIPADLRVLSFSVILTFAVTFLFGLAPALSASEVDPATVLKGGANPHAKGRISFALIVLQVAFCCIVLLTGGLFVGTYRQLANEWTGISSERILVLQTVTAQPQLPIYWSQVAAHLNSLPGVERAMLADRPMLDGGSWNDFVSVDPAVPGRTLTFFRAVSPGWMETMRIPMLGGREFREQDLYPGAAIVNESFAKLHFPGVDPVGKFFFRGSDERHQIVGLVRDTRYRNLREPVPPTAFFPFSAVNKAGEPAARAAAAIVVRTATPNPFVLAPLLRQEVMRANSAFRVSRIRTQQEIIDAHSITERLLAMLAVFFAGVALLLAGVGLYGVLDYSVLQRRREIGIRLALGGRAARVAGQVTRNFVVAAATGAVLGFGVAMAAERYVATLLYQVKATDPAMLAWPMALLLAVALAALAPPAFRAIRMDPAKTLRSE